MARSETTFDHRLCCPTGHGGAALLRRFLRFGLALGALGAAVALGARPAHAQESSDASSAMYANRGFHLRLGPTILLPMREDGPWGGGLNIDGRYGIRTGPVVVAPGGRVAGYLISQRGVAIAMPTFRVTAPVGPLAPYLLGGVGAGWLSNDAETGVALLGGGGLMIHVGNVFAFGAEASYQAITGTELHGVTIGPAIVFGG